MAVELKLRGGSSAETATFTGSLREVTVDTSKKTLVVHDGVTQGGTPLATEAQVNQISDNIIQRSELETVSETANSALQKANTVEQSLEEHLLNLPEPSIPYSPEFYHLQITLAYYSSSSPAVIPAVSSTMRKGAIYAPHISTGTSSFTGAIIPGSPGYFEVSFEGPLDFSVNVIYNGTYESINDSGSFVGSEKKTTIYKVTDDGQGSFNFSSDPVSHPGWNGEYLLSIRKIGDL